MIDNNYNRFSGPGTNPFATTIKRDYKKTIFRLNKHVTKIVSIM